MTQRDMRKYQLQTITPSARESGRARPVARGPCAHLRQTAPLPKRKTKQNKKKTFPLFPLREQIYCDAAPWKSTRASAQVPALRPDNYRYIYLCKWEPRARRDYRVEQKHRGKKGRGVRRKSEWRWGRKKGEERRADRQHLANSIVDLR